MLLQSNQPSLRNYKQWSGQKSQKWGQEGKQVCPWCFFNRLGPDPGPTEGSDTIPIRFSRSDLEENVRLYSIGVQGKESNHYLHNSSGKQNLCKEQHLHQVGCCWQDPLVPPAPCHLPPLQIRITAGIFSCGTHL